MIISRTPFRISFFGGGTDYPDWYETHGGQVLATTIDHYCYISCRELPPFFDHNFRIAYSKIENTKTIDEIMHPSVRECLKFMNVQGGLEIHHDSDLPARTGLGSSSSFTVGLLHTLYRYQKTEITKHELALNAIEVERCRLKETVGNQDQTAAAYGGFNHIVFNKDGSLNVTPIGAPQKRFQELNQHLLLFYTGISRFASEVAKDQVSRIQTNTSQLHKMHQLVSDALAILKSKSSILEFGDLLHENWLMKRSLSDKISNTEIDQMYNLARKCGAIGGKLLGAGSGGFFLIFAAPEQHAAIKRVLHNYLCIPFKFEKHGTEIIFCESDDAPL